MSMPTRWAMTLLVACLIVAGPVMRTFQPGLITGSLFLKGAEVFGSRVILCSCGWKSLLHLVNACLASEPAMA